VNLLAYSFGNDLELVYESEADAVVYAVEMDFVKVVYIEADLVVCIVVELVVDIVVAHIQVYWYFEKDIEAV
jgi:hypothetical protein